MTIEQYFNTMPIADYQKQRRIKTANNLKIAVLAYFLLAKQGFDETNDIDLQFLIAVFTDDYKRAITEDKDITIDSYVLDHIERIIPLIVQADAENTEERADKIACNEASVLWNYEEYKEFKDMGYTHKIWHTEMDDRVRDTHKGMEAVTIPIDEYFDVHGWEMLFPGDDSLGAPAEEIVNCRCSLSYI